MGKKINLSDKKKSNLSKDQYKFLSEMIWGNVPIERDWAEETNIFKEKSYILIKKYPKFDINVFNK